MNCFLQKGQVKAHKDLPSSIWLRLWIETVGAGGACSCLPRPASFGSFPREFRQIHRPSSPRKFRHRDRTRDLPRLAGGMHNFQLTPAGKYSRAVFAGCCCCYCQLCTACTAYTLHIATLHIATFKFYCYLVNCTAYWNIELGVVAPYRGL